MTFLDYIESTGSQYINTGIIPSAFHGIEVRCRTTEVTTNWDTIFGIRSGNYGRFTLRYANTVNGALQIQRSQSPSSYFNSYTSTILKNADGLNWHTFKQAGEVFSIDGETKYTFSVGSIGAFSFPLFLFALNDAGTPTDFAYLQISRCRIWDGAGNLVRDLLPVLDDDNTACMYDVVSQSLFYSDEDDFIAGTTATQYVVRFMVDGSCAETEVIARGTATALTENEITKPDQDFIGWDTDVSADTVVYTDNQSVTDIAQNGETITLYAVWRKAWAWLLGDKNGKYYTVTRNGEEQIRTQLAGISSLTAAVFYTHGFQFIPDSSVLIDLPSPRLYKWNVSERPQLSAKVAAVPLVPQLVVFDTMTLSSAVKYINISADDNSLWNVSFDGGNTWWKHTGSAWAQCSTTGDGCIKRRLEILPASAWAQKVNNSIKFRVWLVADSWVKRIRVDY